MYDLIVIGGGPAGIAAAYEAYKNGVGSILIIEREKELGGILNQCIHNGFGLHTFKEELTGPEYAYRFIDMIRSTKVEIKVDTMVLKIETNKKVHTINVNEGYKILESKAIILAMGCRERTRGSISIPGDRPSGVFTAGAAQRYINIDGYMPGKEVVILGSGDIGLIMARRMMLEGAKVKAVVEIMNYSNGLNRNIVQCLDDYNIPLYLSHTVVDVIGKSRVESVVIAEVDKDRNPIKGTEKEMKCDTLLLSVGLVPENELSKSIGIDIDKRTNGVIVNESMETSIDGIFACGNVVHVHDLVDFVTEESMHAGKSVAKYINSNKVNKGKVINIITGENINYTVPQKLNIGKIEEKLTIFMRVNNIYKNKMIVLTCGDEDIVKVKKEHLSPAEMEKLVINKDMLKKIDGDIKISLKDDEEKNTVSIDVDEKDINVSSSYEKLICICCPRGCHLKVDVKEKKVIGNNCEKGEAYGISEVSNPVRIVTTTARVKKGSFSVVPVKSKGCVPKELNLKCIKIINQLELELPIRIGDVICENILETGVDIVACKNIIMN